MSWCIGWLGLHLEPILPSVLEGELTVGALVLGLFNKTKHIYSSPSTIERTEISPHLSQIPDLSSPIISSCSLSFSFFSPCSHSLSQFSPGDARAVADGYRAARGDGGSTAACIKGEGKHFD